MDNLAVLNKYFFGGEAEAEANIRNEIFVPPNNLSNILSFSRSRYRILLGAKGVGKSLLINVLNESALEDNAISVLLKPGDFDCETIAKKSANSDKVSSAYNQLLKAIGAKIGQYSTGLIVNESKINLNQLSVSEGISKPDAMSRFASFLTEITPVAKEYAVAAQKIQKLNSHRNILRKDISNVLNNNKQKFWLLIDDVDQAAITSANCYDYSVCWAIVAATIQLANDFDQVRSLISVRTDIWHTMTVAKRLGSDILDKIQEPIYLEFSEKEIGDIFTKRIELSNKEISPRNYNQDVLNYFDNRMIKLPGAKEIIRSWDHWIRKQSRNRPRDMIQLVQQLIEQAELNKSNKILEKHAYDIMLSYAKKRIENIEKEYREICPQVKSIIKDLSTETLFKFEDVVNILKRCPSSRSIMIDNVAIKANTKEAAISILHVLHMANFINARIDLSADNSQPNDIDEYDHITFSMRPDLVTSDNWNEMQKYKWEIHPVFHPYVHEITTNKRHVLIK